MGDYSDKDNIVFQSGDFVVDLEYNEVGLLLLRFNLVDDDTAPIYGWDIIWSGCRYSMKGYPRRAPYTEESLKNMVIEGVFTLYKK